MSQLHDNLQREDLPEIPHSLYRADQVRELDRLAIEQEGIPGLELMERAGAAAFTLLRHRWPRGKMIGVLCGTGNNGGDGFVLARLAHQAGYDVCVWQLGESEPGSSASSAREAMEAAGLHAKVFDRDAFSAQEILVDGLLGTGLHEEVKSQWREARHKTRPPT